MNILVGVISPAPVWVIPRSFVEQLGSAFPQHRFLEAWDREAIRRLLPEADVAFTPFIDRDAFPTASRLRWVQSPAVGVGSLMFPELLSSPVVITSARGIRARSIAEHVIGATIALARRLPAALRAQQAHRWAQDELEGPGSAVRSLDGLRMGIVGLGSIGMEIVRLATPFGIRISAIRRRAQDPPPAGVDHVYAPDRLHEIVETSDILVLAVPHTASAPLAYQAVLEAQQFGRVGSSADIAREAGRLLANPAAAAAAGDAAARGAATLAGAVTRTTGALKTLRGARA